MSFSPGDVLLVPVVFSDGSGHKKARSPREAQVVNWQRAGLRLPSIVRLEKLATVEKSTVVRKMGRLTPDEWEKVKTVLKQFFADILDR
jgi:mRNA-degrading endonuclease toxin of MazEF toxin-antitoxin module